MVDVGSARGNQIREQLTAALRDAELPLSTDEVAKFAPPITIVWPCSRRLHQLHREPGWSNGWVTVVASSCTGTRYTEVRTCLGRDVYPHLRVLEAQGICIRTRLDHDQRVFWTYTGDLPASLALLEELWEASS